MKKYIAETLAKLSAFIEGMKQNPNDWTNQPVKLVDVQASCDSLNIAGVKIDNSEANLKVLRHQGSLENSESKSLYKQCENFAYAIYADNPDKLAQYGIKPKKEPVKVPQPSEILAVILEDDIDAEGFVVSIKARDKVADSYEWQKGQGVDAKEITIIPQLYFLKSTSKISFIDDNIEKGVRYFYRVRAMNHSGYGPWSEAASRVQ